METNKITPSHADAAIAALSEISHPRIAPWHFVPTGEFIVNEAVVGAHKGDITFEDKAWEMGHAIRARDWVFALARHVDDTSPPNEWLLCGFHGHALHFFQEIHSPNPDELRRAFYSFTVELFWTILFPQVPKVKGKADITIRHMASDSVTLDWALI